MFSCSESEMTITITLIGFTDNDIFDVCGSLLILGSSWGHNRVILVLSLGHPRVIHDMNHHVVILKSSRGLIMHWRLWYRVTHHTGVNLESSYPRVMESSWSCPGVILRSDDALTFLLLLGHSSGWRPGEHCWAGQCLHSSVSWHHNLPRSVLATLNTHAAVCRLYKLTNKIALFVLLNGKY